MCYDLLHSFILSDEKKFKNKPVYQENEHILSISLNILLV